MRITVLTVPGCPNAPLAQERIAAALAGRPAEVELVEVRQEAEAARWGMTGSPTVLIDGVDPCAVTSAPSMSCRLYRTADGRTDGAPSVKSLRQALAGKTPPPAARRQLRQCREVPRPGPPGPDRPRWQRTARPN